MTVTQIRPHTIGHPAERKPRCRVLDRRRNPCSNEAIDEEGYCLHHLEAITRYWCELLAGKLRLIPSAAEDAERIAAVLDTLRRYT